MRRADVARVIELADTLDGAPRWASDVYHRALDPETSPARISLVAENSDDGITGFLITVLIPPHAEVEMLAVSKGARRQGIARGLMAVLMADLIRRQVTKVMLEVRESNLPARMLYASLGFEETGRRAAYYSDPQEDAIQLQQSVGG